MVFSATNLAVPIPVLTMDVSSWLQSHLGKAQRHRRRVPLRQFLQQVQASDHADTYPTFHETSINDRAQEYIRSECP